jgi:hypothetical protein
MFYVDLKYPLLYYKYKNRTYRFSKKVTLINKIRKYSTKEKININKFQIICMICMTKCEVNI